MITSKQKHRLLNCDGFVRQIDIPTCFCFRITMQHVRTKILFCRCTCWDITSNFAWLSPQKDKLDKPQVTR